jgi:hypothetical protein
MFIAKRTVLSATIFAATALMSPVTQAEPSEASTKNACTKCGCDYSPPPPPEGNVVLSGTCMCTGQTSAEVQVRTSCFTIASANFGKAIVTKQPGKTLFRFKTLSRPAPTRIN